MLQWTLAHMDLSELVFSLSFDRYPEVKLLDYSSTIFIFEEPPYLLFEIMFEKPP